jgi:ribosomal protein S18 acetylase RimI-like enzyme
MLLIRPDSLNTGRPFRIRKSEIAMSSSLRLRDATAADEEFLFSVYAASRDREFDDAMRATPQIQAFLKSQFTLQDIHYKATYPNAEWKIIALNGEKIGRFYFEDKPNQISLIDLSILPEFRGNKYGSILIGRKQQEAAERAIPVKLHVEATNIAARKLYKRLGFEDAETSSYHIPMHWHPKA